LESLRHKNLPSYQSEDAEDPYAVIFVVEDTRTETNMLFSEEDILQASTHALTALLLDSRVEVTEALTAWMDGRIRKIVKRAKNSAWVKTQHTKLPYREASYGTATVRVFAPIPLSTQPSALKKLQVSGLQADTGETNANEGKPSLHIFVDETLDMSTGKLVAQVGHAVQLFLMYAYEAKVFSWLETGQLIRVTRTPVMPNENEVDVFVRDAGFTEVPAGSITAAAIYSIN
jgi:peptidyl-tRNA hydrolase